MTKPGNERIGLGTAQFGLDYGISNVSGRPSAGEVERILALAHNRGIRLLDTASAYGDSESLLGAIDASANFVVVTKTLPIERDKVDGIALSLVAKAFERSLLKLRRERVDGLLVHRAGDFFKPGGEALYRMLAKWRDDGRVGHIGVSIYSPEEGERVLSRVQIDLIQLPLNILDQRALISGFLDRLARSGVEIHARSAFLQGALLMPPHELPEHLLPMREHLVTLGAACAARGWTVQEACLRFVLGIETIDRLICGVNSAAELEQLLNCAQNCWDGFDFRRFAVNDTRLIHPNEWPNVPGRSSK